MSEDKQFDDDLDDLEDAENLDKFTELLGNGHAGSNSARRRIEELKEEQLLRQILDYDYPEMI